MIQSLLRSLRSLFRLPQSNSGMRNVGIHGDSSLTCGGIDHCDQVERNRTGRNTPAEVFEDRLIRHVEQHLGARALSLAGTNAGYWRFTLPGEKTSFDLAVIGPGYNTAETLKPGERWLLRVREAPPGRIAAWLRAHGDDPGFRRTMPDGTMQTQFASSRIGDESLFFAQCIPFPLPEERTDR